MNFIFFFENLSRKYLIIYFILRYLFILIFRGILYEKQANGFKILKNKKNLQLIDIGANDGLSSSFFLDCFYKSKIYIFEPLNLINNVLKSKNNNKIKKFDIGLGNKNSFNYLNIPYFHFLFFKKRFYLSAYSTVSKKNDKIYKINNSLKTFFFL